MEAEDDDCELVFQATDGRQFRITRYEEED